MDAQRFLSSNNGDDDYYIYIDAWGESPSDADYTIGDNVHWRHLKDQDSDFESEDVGTTSTSIGFVDTDSSGGTTTVDIFPFFDEHKKVLRLDDQDGADQCDVFNTFASAQAFGTVEYWWYSTDVTKESNFVMNQGDSTQALTVGTGGASVFRYHDGAFHTIVSASNNTWYHVKIEFECATNAHRGLAADTYYVWINNIQYGPFPFRNVVNTLGEIRLNTSNADSGFTTYIDAFSFSWTSGNQIADNRTFDYLPYTYDDITSEIENCTVSDNGYDGSTAVIVGTTALSLSEIHFVQLYDVNSNLRFEGNISREDTPSVKNTYPLRSFNNDELLDENSYTASAPEDVNASLLAIHTNISQVDGRLIYYTEDDPAGNLTPNFKNKPKKMGIRWFAIHGGKIAPIKANGVFMLDDDRTPEAGAATIDSTTGEILSQPVRSIVKHQINFVEVRGGTDPDTGTPFSGISQDTAAQVDGTGIKPYYKRFRELQSDTDCLNRAIAIRTGNGFDPTIFNVELLGIYAIPGEIINFAYSPFTFSATNMYVESVIFDLVQGIGFYRLNTGIFDVIAINTPWYEPADEASDDMSETLFQTDINTLYLPMFPLFGATEEANGDIQLDGNGEAVLVNIYTPAELDVSRPCKITLVGFRIDAGGDTIDCSRYLAYIPCDNSSGSTVVWNYLSEDWEGVTQTTFESKTITIPASTLPEDAWITFQYRMDEAAKHLDIYVITFQYFIKRIV